MKKVKLKLELQYNSPVILTFFLLSLLALFLDQWTDGWTTMHLFCVYRSSLKDPLFYIRLFGHVLGHASWDHFLNNMLLLLVVGPPMEEKYGSKPLLCLSCFRRWRASPAASRSPCCWLQRCTLVSRCTISFLCTTM